MSKPRNSYLSNSIATSTWKVCENSWRVWRSSYSWFGSLDCNSSLCVTRGLELLQLHNTIKLASQFHWRNSEVTSIKLELKLVYKHNKHDVYLFHGKYSFVECCLVWNTVIKHRWRFVVAKTVIIVLATSETDENLKLTFMLQLQLQENAKLLLV